MRQKRFGRCFSIIQTTAGYAMCYKLTTLYGLAHGHAAALCVEVLWSYMTARAKDYIDSKREAYLQQMLKELTQVMGCSGVEDSFEKYKALLRELALPVPVQKSEGELEFLESSVNPERLKNNPVLLTEQTFEALYRQSLRLDEE